MTKNDKINSYIDEIESRIHDLTGLDLTPMPRAHRDIDTLRMQQFKNIASWLGRIETSGNDDNVLNEARELVTSGTWSKPQIKAILLGSEDDSPDT